LLHVVDASNPNFVEQIAQVQQVLVEIGAADIPQLLVFNKIDALDAEHQPVRVEDSFEIAGVQTPRIFVSARNMLGMQELRARLAQLASAEAVEPEMPVYSPDSSGADL
jgi:GTP-binding protein HflX